MNAESVLKKLGQLSVGEYTLAELNLPLSAKAEGSTLYLKLYKAALSAENREYISRQVQELATENGFEKIMLEFVEEEPRYFNRIAKVIAIMSGKGGVGKSTIAGLTAVALSRAGYKVGLLDADITGPSLPKMFGVSGNPQGNELGFLPLSSRTGIRLISINLLLEDDNSAVIWRGGMISKAISQFWTDVVWGSLDYLVVDLPPGTSDAPLTVLQQLPISGVIMVYTPQNLAAMIVRKAMGMVDKMGKKIIGMVENMSYVDMPDGRRYRPFGQSDGELASISGAPLLGVFPLDSEITLMADSGNIENFISKEFDSFSQALLSAADSLSTNTLEVKTSLSDDPSGGCTGKSCHSCAQRESHTSSN